MWCGRQERPHGVIKIVVELCRGFPPVPIYRWSPKSKMADNAIAGIITLQESLKKSHTFALESAQFRKPGVFPSVSDQVKSINLAKLRRAAVLFLVAELRDRESDERGTLKVLLTRRTLDVVQSPGEVCLPGGHLEEGESVVDAALREVEEEVGITKHHITVLSGELPSMIARSRRVDRGGIAVTPVVAILHSPCELKLCPREVESAFWAPVDMFLQSVHPSTKFRFDDGSVADIQHFIYHCPVSSGIYWIWGLTANICILVSSIVLNQSPQYPFTYLVLDRVQHGKDSVHISMKPLNLKMNSLL